MTDKNGNSLREVTIRDVAKSCNVSIATVSRIINDNGRFSLNTKNKVLKAIKDLNYVPNNNAISMVTKKNKMLGIVVPNLSNPFYSAVIQGAIDTLQGTGYYVTVLVTEDDKSIEEELLNRYLNKGVDGMLLISAHNKPDFFRRIKKPAVLIDRYVEGSGLEGVVIDNLSGVYGLTKLFIEYGHKKIAMINGLLDYNDGLDRYRGYQMALDEYSIPRVKDYYICGLWTQEHGYNSTMKLMQLKDPPTAILAGNNVICEGVLYALRELNLKIGKDISLAGFDETSLADFSIPKITVVRRATSEMGSEGTKLLLELLKGSGTAHKAGTKKIVLPVEILHRESIIRLKQ